MFADDIKLRKKIVQESASQELQEKLVRLDEWNMKWPLTFNIGKCTVMHVGYSVAMQYTTEQDLAYQLWSLVKDSKESFAVLWTKVLNCS